MHVCCKCSSCSWIVPPRYWWRPYISHKIMIKKPYFHILDFFSETANRWLFILCKTIAYRLGHPKIIVKLQHLGRILKMKKDIVFHNINIETSLLTVYKVIQAR